MEQVQTPLDDGLQNGCHLADEEVESPVRGGTQTGTLGPDAQRQNLGRIKPRNGTPRGTKSSIVDHDEDDRHQGGEGQVDVDKIRDQRQGNDHRHGTPQQDRASTPAVDHVPGEHGGRQVTECVDAGHQNGRAADPARGLEDQRSIVGNHVDSVQLGEGLGGHGDKHASVVPAEHLVVRTLSFLALDQDVHFDFPVLLPGLIVVDVSSAVQIGDDNHALLVAIRVQQPPGGIQLINQQFPSAISPQLTGETPG